MFMYMCYMYMYTLIVNLTYYKLDIIFQIYIQILILSI
jgi:hypothetical protein